MTWSERLPGSNAKRLDVINDIAAAVAQDEGWEKSFARVTELRVLSVAQWAQLLGMHRQSVYARIWRMRLPLPGRVLPGMLNPDMIPHMKRVITNCSKGKNPYPGKLVDYGSHELVEYLTGVSLDGDSGSN